MFEICGELQEIIILKSTSAMMIKGHNYNKKKGSSPQPVGARCFLPWGVGVRPSWRVAARAAAAAAPRLDRPKRLDAPAAPPSAP